MKDQNKKNKNRNSLSGHRADLKRISSHSVLIYVHSNIGKRETERREIPKNEK